jgi:hypothetical protein
VHLASTMVHLATALVHLAATALVHPSLLVHLQPSGCFLNDAPGASDAPRRIFKAEKNEFLNLMRVVVLLAYCAASSLALKYSADATHHACSLAAAAIGSLNGWCAVDNDMSKGHYLLMDAEAVVFVSGVSTRGRQGTGVQWVTAYNLSYSVDNTLWRFVPGSLRANVDQNSIVTNPLGALARYVKLVPAAFFSHPSMRAGLVTTAVSCSNGNYFNVSQVGAFILMR